MANPIREAYFGSRYYAWKLRRSRPGHLRGVPPDPWPGDPDAGRAVLEGNYRLFDRTAHLGDLPWNRPSLAPQAAALLHGFGFLRDLRALGTHEAAEQARELVIRWVNGFGTWNRESWTPAVIGERLVNWLTAWHLLVGDEPDERMASLLLESAGAQVHHLASVIDETPRDARDFAACEGLVLGGLCLAGCEDLIDPGLDMLETATANQILADGAHYQRNPMLHHAVLERLLRTRATLTVAHVESPAWLQHAIDRMVPVLRLFQHGDGALALFNGGWQDDAERVRVTLAQSESKARALTSAPHAGFQRLEAVQTAVIADAGAAVVARGDPDAHAGLLSFEFSRRGQRIVVNCGAQPDRSSDWHEALRATAAHSTLTIDDTNAVAVLTGGGIAGPPPEVGCRRSEVEGSTYVQMRHEGYRKAFGLIHNRDLYLAAAGDDFRGHDTLKPAGEYMGTPASRFAARFHLHPDASASLAEGGDSVFVRLPGRETWRFRAAGGDIALEESVYLARSGPVRMSQQIVVSGAIAPPEVSVRWSFIQETRRR